MLTRLGIYPRPAGFLFISMPWWCPHLHHRRVYHCELAGPYFLSSRRIDDSC